MHITKEIEAELGGVCLGESFYSRGRTSYTLKVSEDEMKDLFGIFQHVAGCKLAYQVMIQFEGDPEFEEAYKRFDIDPGDLKIEGGKLDLSDIGLRKCNQD